MKIFPATVALSLALMNAHAHALSFNNPTAVDLNPYVGGVFNGHEALAFSVNQDPGAFTHYFTFSIGDALSNLVAIGYETPITFAGTTYTDIGAYSVRFYQDLGPIGEDAGDALLAGGAASINTVVSTGHYYMKVTGDAASVPGHSGGAYSGAISVSPVPEAETWAMMAAGLGMVGIQLRRRTRSKSLTR